MKTVKTLLSLLVISLITFQSIYSQEEVIYVKMASEQQNVTKEMKTYLIEREIPDAGLLSSEQLKGISQKSCTVLKEMGSDIQWLHSYVAENKVYCLYLAKNEELIRQHALAGGFPVNYITELATVISPETAR